MTEPREPRREKDVHVSSGTYVLDAMDPPERAAFEVHLVDCLRCQTDVREFRETLAGMKELVSQPPPPTLRAAVLRRIRDLPQLPPDPGRGAST